MANAHPLHVGGQLEGLLVLAVPNARVHQLRQLENLQQLRIATQRQRVQAACTIDFRTGVHEALAALLQIGQSLDKRVQLLLGGTELAKDALRAFRCLNECGVIADGQILRLLDDGTMLVGEVALLLAQLLHFVGAQLE